MRRATECRSSLFLSGCPRWAGSCLRLRRSHGSCPAYSLFWCRARFARLRYSYHQGSATTSRHHAAHATPRGIPSPTTQRTHREFFRVPTDRQPRNLSTQSKGGLLPQYEPTVRASFSRHPQPRLCAGGSWAPIRPSLDRERPAYRLSPLPAITPRRFRSANFAMFSLATWPMSIR